MNEKLKVLSLFDGISCARVAIERAGFEIERYYASEIDKYAIQIAQKNYPDTIQLGSVVGLDSSQLKDIDILIGGSPCQDLSIAGKREGLCGARSGLFWEYVRIRNEVKPKYFILENVNSMSKEARATITEALGVEPVMINASLVSAQNRKRLFWVGKLVGDKYKQVNIPQPEDRGIFLKDILEEEVEEKYFVKLSDRYKQENINKDSIGYNPYSDQILNDKARALNIGCGSATTKNATLIKVGHLNKGGQGDRIYSEEGKSVSLKALGGGGGAKNRIRKLTPIECERLQGLPDNYTEVNNDLQIEKIYGNIKLLEDNNLKLWKNVLSQVAKEKKKQILVPVLCTTKDIKDMEVLSYQKNKNLKNVNIVIGWQLQEECATNIIKIGIGTEIHFIQIKLENITEKQLEVTTDIYEMLMENGDIEMLQKNILKDNSEKMRLFIISMLTNLIMTLKTFIYAQEKSICVFTTTLNKLLESYSKKELLVLKMENISLVSNTQRYKALGNAFNVDVVAHIIKNL